MIFFCILQIFLIMNMYHILNGYVNGIKPNRFPENNCSSIVAMSPGSYLGAESNSFHLIWDGKYFPTAQFL